MSPLKTTSRLSALRSPRALVLRAALALAFAGTPAAADAGDVANPFDLPFSGMPVSHATSDFSPVANPVFADILAAPALSYRLQFFDGQNNADHFFLLNVAGFSFAYGLYNNLHDRENERVVGEHADYFSVGKGFWINNLVGVGGSYAFSRSGTAAYDGYGGWSAGLLFQPFAFLSIGFMARDFNAPELDGRRVEPKQVYSISLRPYGRLVTLSLDMVHRGGERPEESNVVLSAELRAWREASIVLNADREGSFFAGARMPFDLTRSGARTVVAEANRLQGARDGRLSQFGLALSGERYAEPVTAFRRILSVRFDRPFAETVEGRLFEKSRPRFFDLLRALRAARDDRSISAIVMRVDAVPYGFAQIQEIRNEIAAFRKSGKRVYATLSEMSNQHYYLASAADEIAFVPASNFYLTGLKAEVYFIKGALDKAGVKYDAVSAGRYKSFNEQFTRGEMSPAYRRNLTAIVGELNRQFLDDIAASRRLARNDVDRLIRRGVASPDEARRAGFIDSVEYPDAAAARIEKTPGAGGATVSLESYLAEPRRAEAWGTVPAIAVVYVEGTIVKGNSRESGLLSPATVGDESYRETLAAAFDDPSVRAVVIRVNSGGGSALASDLMWHYLQERKGATKKPVVISFGSMAASGGYYLACTGDTVFVSAGTLTGSIGVVGGKLSLQRIYRTLGINKDVVKMSEYADILSESRDLSARDRRQFTRIIDFIYRQFTDRVAAGRGIDRASIPAVAEGRLFTGSQALKNRLADELGGLAQAVERARRLAGIGERYAVTHLPEKRASLRDIVSMPRIEAPAAGALAPLVEHLRVVSFGDEPFLYLYPYIVMIK